MNEQNEFGQILGQRLENFKPSLRPEKSVIKGRFCTLDSLDIIKYSKELYASLQMDNPGQSWTYLSYGPFNSYDEFHGWLEEISQSESDTLVYAILDTKTNIPIGYCSYLRINPQHSSIEIGNLHFSKLLSKSTAATEAMYLLMREAFENLGYRRYEWKCNALNAQSLKAAKRLGFQFEGIFRQCNVFKNRNRDTAWFSIIDSEWPELKVKFEKWLDITNFDENGHQINSLGDIRK